MPKASSANRTYRSLHLEAGSASCPWRISRRDIRPTKAVPRRAEAVSYTHLSTSRAVVGCKRKSPAHWPGSEVAGDIPGGTHLYKHDYVVPTDSRLDNAAESIHGNMRRTHVHRRPYAPSVSAAGTQCRLQFEFVALPLAALGEQCAKMCIRDRPRADHAVRN